MSVLAVAVKHLVALGMSGDALAAAIAEMQAAEDTRSVGAKRQQRYRNRLAERNEASQSVTRDDSVTQPLSLDKETLPTPHKEINPIPRDIYPAREAADQPQQIVEAWNAMATKWDLPRVAKLTSERRSRLKSRLAEHSIDQFTEAIAAVASSPFCRGENDRGWKADFDFLLQPKSFTRLIEGSYNGQPSRQYHQPSRGGGFAANLVAEGYGTG